MLDERDLLRVFRDLKATIVEGGMRELLIWYGVDGSQRMPYQRLVDDCFPKSEVRTPPIKAPQPKSQSSARKKLARIAAEKATIEKRLRELNAEARAL